MNTAKQSPWRSALAIPAAIAATLALAACSPESKPPAAAASEAASSASAAASAAGKEPLKIAFVYIDSVGDAGWTFSHDTARKALEAEFGDKIQTSIVDKVPEGADAERVVRDLATQGNGLIIGTSFGYMEPMMKVAKEFPNIKFEHATGYKRSDNMATYDVRTYEGAYMAGVVAGKMTKNNTLGIVASVPIPEVLRNINSFTLGAQSSNPAIKTKVVWVNQWFDPPKETEAATALINGGAGVLFQNTNSTAVLQTAEKMGKRGFGWNSDMTSYGPKSHMASVVINWQPYYSKVAHDVLDGKWQSQHSWWGVKESAIDLTSFSADVPAETKAQIDKVRAGLKDGSFAIWRGPIADNTGKEVLPAGQVADEKFLHGINFYVKGVEGQVPGAK